MNFDLPDERLAAALAPEIARTFLAGGTNVAALPPALADLVREGVAMAVQRELANRPVVSIEEIATSMGWSVRRFRAWAREANVPISADAARVEDVRAALDFGDGAKSKARRDLEKQIEDLRLQVARLSASDRRRAKHEKLLP